MEMSNRGFDRNKWIEGEEAEGGRFLVLVEADGE